MVLGVVGVLYSAGVAIGAGEGKAVELSARLEVGQERRYRYSVESEMSVSLMGQAHELEMDKRCTVRTEVLEVGKDGLRRVALVHERIELEVEGDVPGSFDSDKPGKKEGDNVYGRLLRPLVGVELIFVVDVRGKVRDVEGLEKIRPADMLERRLFMSLFGKGELVSMYEPLFGLKPDGEPAEIRDSWKIERSRLSGLGIASTKILFRLENVRGGDARVRVGGEERFEGMNAESEIEGHAVWDVERGVLRELKTESVTTFEPDSQLTGVAISGEIHAKTALEEIDASGR